MRLSLLKENYAIVKLQAGEAIPSWASEFDGGLLSITYTSDELSIVCNEDKVPIGMKNIEKTWNCLKIEGVLDFSLTGILQLLLRPLAEHKISIFAISTFNTDYLLIKSENIEKAIEVLINEGHEINKPY
ncbi:ACT domain-containing protein [Paenibacillus turpanensis]|uniref:ACT domain-containing protein n=1 Tax=Paenibacillus turpanensis TaxID=2689078 RepID=UPI001409C4E7|nr:ACT domain-containing protein [Paenibacillus turpanensis]